MGPNEYQKLALRTSVGKLPDFMEVSQLVAPDGTKSLGNHDFSRLVHGAFGMVTETGELVDMIKKHLMYGKPFDRTNVLEECGDTLWYIALALDACGFSVEEAMERNIAKLLKRYPDKFTAELAINRDVDAERKVLEGEAP